MLLITARDDIRVVTQIITHVSTTYTAYVTLGGASPTTIDGAAPLPTETSPGAAPPVAGVDPGSVPASASSASSGMTSDQLGAIIGGVLGGVFVLLFLWYCCCVFPRRPCACCCAERADYPDDYGSWETGSDIASRMAEGRRREYENRLRLLYGARPVAPDVEPYPTYIPPSRPPGARTYTATRQPQIWGVSRRP